MLSRDSSDRDLRVGQIGHWYQVVVLLNLLALISLSAMIASGVYILGSIKGPSPDELWYNTFEISIYTYPATIIILLIIHLRFWSWTKYATISGWSFLSTLPLIVMIILLLGGVANWK